MRPISTPRPRFVKKPLARPLTAVLTALLLASLPGLAAAQSLQELYDAARGFDASFLAARANAQSAEYRASLKHS